jgi:hypothetical protein
MLCLGFVNLIIVVLVTFNFCKIKRNTGQHWLSKMFKNQKIYILLIGILMNVCVLLHYGVNITGIWYEQLGLLEILLRYAGLFTIVYFVFRKASKPLKNKWKYINFGILPAIFISFICNISLLIYLEVLIARISNTSDPEDAKIAASKLSCNQPIWMVSSIFDFVSFVIFWFFIIKLEEVFYIQ